MRMLKVIAVVLVGFVLITRFVSVKESNVVLSPRQISCRADAAVATLESGDLAPCAVLDAINQEYLSSIKPIFEAKCLTCHGTVTAKPLYTRVYPIKWRTDRNIAEALEDMDMRYDFPFRAKAAAKKHRKDLHEIAEVLDENEMPPWDYRVLHWNSGVTKAEKEIILKWVENGRKILKQ